MRSRFSVGPFGRSVFSRWAVRPMYNFMIALGLLSLLMVAAVPMFVVELPEELVTLLQFAIMFAVTGLLKWLGGLLGKDISGWGAIIAGALVSAVVALCNALLSAIPIEWEQAASLILQLLVVLLGGMGAYSLKTHIARSLLK